MSLSHDGCSGIDKLNEDKDLKLKSTRQYIHAPRHIHMQLSDSKTINEMVLYLTRTGTVVTYVYASISYLFPLALYVLYLKMGEY